MLFMHLPNNVEASVALQNNIQSLSSGKCLSQLGQLPCQCITEKIIRCRNESASPRGWGRGECTCERRSSMLHEIISSSINYPAHRPR